MREANEIAWRALNAGAVMFEVSGRALVRVTGRDRASWLNGVVTQDVRHLATATGVYAASVAVKGRLLGDLIVLAETDALVLALPAEQVDTFMAHFDRYIVMEDVTLTPDPRGVLTVQGPRAAGLTEGFAGRFAVDRLGTGGVDLLGDAETLAAHRAALIAAGAVAVDGATAGALHVFAGRPRWGVDFGGDNFVQEASVTAQAVSFHKGCYLGQEVVCRLEMRGHVQKQLVTLRLAAPATAGAGVFHEAAQVGAVTSVASREGLDAALAMVKYAVVDKGLAVTVEAQPAQVGPVGKAVA
ncbi:MAG: hypothetical protein JNK72_20215 [Myxococcales bacterium]|nr:hypothetical protein [Myxococcales bacterium]